MKNENLYWIDSLRVLATFSVVFLHISSEILPQYGSVSNFDWWVGNIYDSSVRFCVPVFLMISGVLILSKTYESIGEYLKKRVLRILFPFLFWSIIYITKDIFFKFLHGEEMSLTEILKFSIIKLKNGACFHLWYIYMIIGLYLFFPIIGKWLNKSNKQELKYFIGIWLITIFAKLPFIKEIFPNIDLTYFSGYIGFPILGYYVNITIFSNSYKEKAISILLILTGILITIFGTFFITNYEGSFNHRFYDYLTPNVILVSVGVFLLFKNLAKCDTKISPVISFFSRYSYGVYLVHILVYILILSVFSKFGFSYSFLNPIVGIPIMSVLCFIISILIIWIINKLPYGKYISG